MSADEPDTIAEARAEVERTREELGSTVEALAHQTDVKARAREKVDEVKAQAVDASGGRIVPLAVAGAAAGLLVLVLVLRRRGR
jgi:hypothetical protein